MATKSLRKRLLITISVLIIASGGIISQLVTHLYSESLFQGALAQAENIAHSLALEATDRLLINDLVALQKLLDDQLRSNMAIAYLFISRNDSVLIHTFRNGIPEKLPGANAPTDGATFHLEKIISNEGERYLDIAWPIFSSKVGVLRLGYSEGPYRRQVARLWIQMSGVTLSILLLSLFMCHLFIRRTTRPLTRLTEAVEKIDEGNLDVSVDVRGHDEVGMLATSFDNMLTRVRGYTQRLEEHAGELEEKNLELDRAHRQTRTSFAIAQEIGALPNLADVGAYLVRTIKGIVTCRNMALLIPSADRDELMVLSERESRTFKHLSAEGDEALFNGSEEMRFLQRSNIDSVPLPPEFDSVERMALFTLHHEQQHLGGMLVGCETDCRCITEELDVINLILGQASGAIKRSVSQEEEIRRLRTRIEQSAGFSGLIGKNTKMQAIYRLIEDVAPTDATVLIQGESGTGKELVAHAIHRHSGRKDGPFVVINCSAYPASLLESELFGHEKGAFTGAIRRRIGRFEEAHSGTVFLDEIGEISPSAQIKLLRVLQTQRFKRIGGDQVLSVDMRILAATNKDLLREVKKGNFREDLYYRLNVIPIVLPSLNERRNDIPILARHFLGLFSTEQGKDIEDFSPEAMRRLLEYSWPGNVRELENAIEHVAVLAKGRRIEVTDLPSPFSDGPSIGNVESAGTMLENEKRLLKTALEECDWNKKRAAARLGISRSSLYSKLNRYQITRPATPLFDEPSP